jgi:uncharacterized membrane protein YqjE
MGRESRKDKTVPSRLDSALKFILAATVMASLVMIGGIAWLFSNDEVQGAMVMLIVLVLGYTAIGLAWVVRQRRG